MKTRIVKPAPKLGKLKLSAIKKAVASVKTPNADTASAIKELKNGGGKRYRNSQEMHDDLRI